MSLMSAEETLSETHLDSALSDEYVEVAQSVTDNPEDTDNNHESTAYSSDNFEDEQLVTDPIMTTFSQENQLEEEEEEYENDSVVSYDESVIQLSSAQHSDRGSIVSYNEATVDQLEQDVDSVVSYEESVIQLSSTPPSDQESVTSYMEHDSMDEDVAFDDYELSNADYNRPSYPGIIDSDDIEMSAADVTEEQSDQEYEDDSSRFDHVDSNFNDDTASDITAEQEEGVADNSDTVMIPENVVSASEQERFVDGDMLSDDTTRSGDQEDAVTDMIHDDTAASNEQQDSSAVSMDIATNDTATPSEQEDALDIATHDTGTQEETFSDSNADTVTTPMEPVYKSDSNTGTPTSEEQDTASEDDLAPDLKKMLYSCFGSSRLGILTSMDEAGVDIIGNYCWKSPNPRLKLFMLGFACSRQLYDEGVLIGRDLMRSNELSGDDVEDCKSSLRTCLSQAHHFIKDSEPFNPFDEKSKSYIANQKRMYNFQNNHKEYVTAKYMDYYSFGL